MYETSLSFINLIKSMFTNAGFSANNNSGFFGSNNNNNNNSSNANRGNKGNNGFSGGMQQGRAVCQYFLKGNCKFGNKCGNLHERPQQQANGMGNNNSNMLGGGFQMGNNMAVIPNNNNNNKGKSNNMMNANQNNNKNIPCKYFLKGKCNQGNNCEYLHAGAPANSLGMNNSNGQTFGMQNNNSMNSFGFNNQSFGGGMNQQAQQNQGAFNIGFNNDVMGGDGFGFQNQQNNNSNMFGTSPIQSSFGLNQPSASPAFGQPQNNFSNTNSTFGTFTANTGFGVNNNNNIQFGNQISGTNPNNMGFGRNIQGTDTGNSFNIAVTPPNNTNTFGSQVGAQTFGIDVPLATPVHQSSESHIPFAVPVGGQSSFSNPANNQPVSTGIMPSFGAGNNQPNIGNSFQFGNNNNNNIINTVMPTSNGNDSLTGFAGARPVQNPMVPQAALAPPPTGSYIPGVHKMSAEEEAQVFGQMQFEIGRVPENIHLAFQ